MQQNSLLNLFPFRVGDRVARLVEAQRVLAQLQNQSTNGYVPSHCFAYVHEGLGDFEQANTWMKKAIAAREFPLVYLKVEADEVSRANPHYREWLQNIGLH